MSIQFSGKPLEMIKLYICTIARCVVLLLAFSGTVSAEEQRYGAGVEMFSLGYSTYQNGSPPDTEGWSGPSFFFTYKLSNLLSLKASYYALSTEGYDMVDLLPWRTFKKVKDNDMNGVQAALQIGRKFYGSVGVYKNFKDFLYVVDKQGLSFSGGYKIKIGDWLVDVNPFGFRVPMQKEGAQHISHIATLGVSYAF